MSDNRPIGLLDSGVGGLTVARAIMDMLPNEKIIYFGDTKRMPYGPKPLQSVRAYTKEIVAHLQKQDVKLVVVACNTATAATLFDDPIQVDVPIMGVIRPAVEQAIALTRTGQIGVIGTQGTVESKAYDRSLVYQLAHTHRAVEQHCCKLDHYDQNNLSSERHGQDCCDSDRHSQEHRSQDNHEQHSRDQKWCGQGHSQTVEGKKESGEAWAITHLKRLATQSGDSQANNASSEKSSSLIGKEINLCKGTQQHKNSQDDSRSRNYSVEQSTVTQSVNDQENAHREALPTINLASQACPDLVTFAEEGRTSDAQVLAYTQRILAPLQAQKVDTLILGCTHYPLLTGVIGHVMGPNVALVSSAEATARKVFSYLVDNDLLASEQAPPTHEFIATASPQDFALLAQRFLGPRIKHTNVTEVQM